MAKQLDWDQVSRQKRAQLHGTENAYGELPPVGSWADRQRVASRKNQQKKARSAAESPKKVLLKRVEPKPLTQCPLCGNMVGKMKRHLRRAHGAIPGHEHEAPITAPSNDEITP